MSNEQKGEIVTTNEPEILGYMTNTEHLSQDGKGIPRFCDEVAIVGFAPSSMEDVQFLFGKQNVEIWPLNQLYIAWPRIVPANRMEERRNVTRWFQIHHRHTYDQTVARDHSHHEWLTKQTDFPIYMMDKESDVPASCRFPKEQILDKFRRYFTNTISWEIALAIYEGFKKIYIFGVDMAQDCVAPETKVLTADLKWVPAGEIKVGEKVMAFDELGIRNYKIAEVLEANKLVRPSYKITMMNDVEIVCSAGHQWLTSKNINSGLLEWERTDQLYNQVNLDNDISIIKCDNINNVISIIKNGNDVEMSNDSMMIKNIEKLGRETVIGFKTSTKTFVAEGFASHNSEYSFERPSVEYFCGYAEGAGIELVIPEKSDLLKSAYIYPFEDTSPIKTKMESRKSELRSRMNNAALAEQNAHDERMQLVGALENMNYVRRAWMDPITDEGLFGKKE